MADALHRGSYRYSVTGDLILSQAVSTIQSVDKTLCQSICDYIWCGCNRSKMMKAAAMLEKHYAKQLDIRRLMATAIGFRPYARCQMSSSHKLLMAHQKTNLVVLEDGAKTETSSSEGVTFDKIDARNFGKAFDGFEPRDGKERKLIKGILVRKGKVSKD